MQPATSMTRVYNLNAEKTDDFRAKCHQSWEGCPIVVSAISSGASAERPTARSIGVRSQLNYASSYS